MKVIIAGSRDITDLNVVREAVNRSRFPVSEVLSGCARGVDILGEIIASELNVPVRRFPARWKEEGKRAGYIRNEEMAANAEALVAIWNGISKGTFHMIDIATKKKLKVYVYRVDIERFEI